MNTRFNPTANGPLHIGHIYMALLNEHMAHESGGRFILRLDDNTWTEVEKVGGPKKVKEYAERQIEDLEWMGLQIDKAVYQSHTEEAVREYLAHTHFRMVPDQWCSSETMPILHFTSVYVPQFPLATLITAEKVVLDRWEDVDAIIRGPELLSEHAFYMYFCALFGFRFPKCYYVARLQAGDENISKTLGEWGVQDLRDAGATPAQIHNVLRWSCLKEPSGVWHISNVKTPPILTVGSIEDVLR